VIRKLPELTLRWPIGHGLRLTVLPQNVTIITHCWEARTAVRRGTRPTSWLPACRPEQGVLRAGGGQ
jgi:hypothetical protein